MPLVGAETLPDSITLPINIASINTFCPECFILVIIVIIRWLPKLSGRKVHFFLIIIQEALAIRSAK